MRMEELFIPEWGLTVWVRTLTGEQRDRYEATVADGVSQGREHFRARFAAQVCCDADGAFIFTGADVEWLTKKNAAALNRILDAGLRLSGMTAADVDGLEKNSDGDPSADSGSD